MTPDAESPPSLLLRSLLHHYDAVKEHLRRRFGDRDFAADVMQDLCVRILESPPRHDIKTPEHFLRHASTHLAIDRWRSNGARASSIAVHGELQQDSSRAQDPEALAISRQTAESLLAAVHALPERCREVFILVDLHDVPQAEAAKTLGISRGMVAKHLLRARRAIGPLMDINSRSHAKPPY